MNNSHVSLNDDGKTVYVQMDANLADFLAQILSAVVPANLPEEYDEAIDDLYNALIDNGDANESEDSLWEVAPIQVWLDI